MRHGVTEAVVERVVIQPVRPFGRPGRRTRSQPPAVRASTGSTVRTPVIGRRAAIDASPAELALGAGVRGLRREQRHEPLRRRQARRCAAPSRSSESEDERCEDEPQAGRSLAQPAFSVPFPSPIRRAVVLSP